MSSFPFWAYPAISLLGLLGTGGIVYLMANSKRNNKPKTVAVVAHDGQLVGTGYMRRSRTFAEVTVEILDEVGNRVRPTAEVTSERNVGPKRHAVAPADTSPKI